METTSSPSEARGAPRVLDLLVESAAMARSQPVASGVTALIVGTACAVILATTGQTAQAERDVLGRIDQSGTRTITVVDVEGKADIRPAAVGRISALSGAEWAIGFGAARDARNAILGSGGEPVAARMLYGELPPAVRTGGRSPAPGEALVGPVAADTLGLEVGIGGLVLSDGAMVPVVGWFEAAEPLGFLNRTILVWPPEGDQGPLAFVTVLARTPEQVSSLIGGVEQVLGPAEPGSFALETSEVLAQLRAAVAGELGRYGRRLVTLALAVALVLVGLNVYGSVTMRKRDFGRRRALGASRSTITGLVVLQTLEVALAGAVVGGVAGAALVWRWSGGLPAAGFLGGVVVLAGLTAVVAAVPTALAAAYRDPIHVLRIP